MAVLPAQAQKDIGADTHTVLLSRASATKQRAHHPEMTAGEYRGLQGMLDRGTREQQTANRTRVFGEIGGKPYRAVLKVTSKEVYLLSMHRLPGK
ncbi:hypothetical protein [Roseomonas populi]|uniref:DUF4258 domain-containing protein n=1 Tax=Roseomonas populi TaxID=3121582 RepID=A0ABT1X320_9PROT|nr:hypothetical protein [Roseomonas pecuniae]MCR0981798.1 hypothetical protein [Roseomonas pecuniae]